MAHAEICFERPANQRAPYVSVQPIIDRSCSSLPSFRHEILSYFTNNLPVISLFTSRLHIKQCEYIQELCYVSAAKLSCLEFSCFSAEFSCSVLYGHDYSERRSNHGEQCSNNKSLCLLNLANQYSKIVVNEGSIIASRKFDRIFQLHKYGCAWIAGDRAVRTTQCQFKTKIQKRQAPNLLSRQLQVKNVVYLYQPYIYGDKMKNNQVMKYRKTIYTRHSELLVQKS